MKKILLITLLFLFNSLLVKSQITTGENPVSLELKNKFQLERLALIELEIPNLQEIANMDKIMDEIPGTLRFAYPVLTNFNLENSGSWTDLDDGSKLWRLELVLPGALSTHTIYDKFWLPDGAKFFVYNEKTQSFIGAVTSEFIDGTFENPKGYSTGILLGETVIYEYYQPATVKDKPIIEISRIDYGYRFLNYVIDAIRPSKSGDSFQYTGNDAAWCQVNINCSPEGDNWQNDKNAVARIVLIFPDHSPTTKGSYWCTGALVNNTKNDYAPFLLTANHCLSSRDSQIKFDALGNNDIEHWIFYWHFEHTGCSNPGPFVRPPNYITRSTRGAMVIANDSPSDFALLKLKEDPRTLINHSVTPYYLGWDATGSPGGSKGVCIHHPRGDVKKISTYNETPVSTTYLNYSTIQNGTHWRIIYVETGVNRHGVTEGGSSGAPLINNNHKIIGQLNGGRSDCTEWQHISTGVFYGKNQPDWFGKFSVSWNANSIPQRQLKHWLAPAPSTTTVLNGLTVCPSITLFGTQTTKRVECREIIIQNATVPSNTTLELNATDRVIINSGFTVQSGATFIIE